VANVRAHDVATLSEGRHAARVRMVELDPERAAPVLRHFGDQVPAGVAFLKRSGLVTRGTTEEVVALAGRLPVFRVDALA
jgi:hypothetical protein